MTENGYKAIYRKGGMLRSNTDYDASFDIFSFNKDYSGTDLYNKNGHRVFWEKCSFDFGLKGVFSFDFGKKIENDLPIGDLKKFDFYLDGKLNIDLLLKYIYTAQFKDSKESLIKKNILPMMTVKFVVGTVPVVIFIDTHLYNRYEMEANAEVTLSAGCNIQTNAKMGLSCTRDGISPIKSFTPSFTLYDPTFTAKGSLIAKGSIYPRIEFEIYKCLCPWVEPMPYLKEDLGAGMRASTDGNNYLAWTSKTYAGFDCRMGTKMDFGMLIPFVDIWTSDIYNPIDYLLFDAPKKIGLNSPVNGTKLMAGNPVDVSFYVNSFNNITGNYYPCLGGLVNFNTQGNVNKLFAIANKDGLVTVQWTPKDDKDFLTAKLVDKDGQAIAEATFTPKLEEEDGDWVLINGVKWATRNVGTPGTFVQNPENYGGYYQWNKGTTDFLLRDNYDNSSYHKSTSWLPANDPSPAGYCVPTSAEIQSLRNSAYVKYEWTTRNGVYSGRFTDRASGKYIFLPAAGYRHLNDGTLNCVGSDGFYWGSDSEQNEDYAYCRRFNSGYAYGGPWGLKSFGCSVRPVAE